MTTFIQLHLLTSYPPSNLNRDDLGRPKTAVMGGVQRLRVSSQSLKRAWRTSALFEEALAGHLGVRTKEMGVAIYRALSQGKPLAEVASRNGRGNGKAQLSKVKESSAQEWAKKIAEVFGKPKASNTKNPLQELEIEQLAHFSPDEVVLIGRLIETLRGENRSPKDEELKLLRKKHQAADIALFGRMLAADPGFNTDAAVQVAHAVTVHKVAVEDDYFTAVDDLNAGDEDAGAGHVGTAEFAAGLFYLYICIDRDLLMENLGGDEELLKKSIRALTEAATTVAPGKQNSFASRSYASFVMAEKGAHQPRSLSVAFLKPVAGDDFLHEATTALRDTAKKMDKVYGKAPARIEVDAAAGTGTLHELLEFVVEPAKVAVGTP